MRDNLIGAWHFGQGGRSSGIRGSERLVTVNSAGIECVRSFQDPSRLQIISLQADHFADSIDQQREQHQGDDEVFDAFAAALVELMVEIKVQGVV